MRQKNKDKSGQTCTAECFKNKVRTQTASGVNAEVFVLVETDRLGCLSQHELRLNERCGVCAVCSNSHRTNCTDIDYLEFSTQNVCAQLAVCQSQNSEPQVSQAIQETLG